MPYATNVTAFFAVGSALNVEGQLWETSIVIDSQGHSHRRQVSQETVPVVAGTVTFTSGPNFLSNNNHGIALSIDIPGAPGPLFRSGVFPNNLPAGAPASPAGLVEVLDAGPQVVSIATIAAGLPATPFTVPGDPSTTITVLTLIPASRSMTLTVTGTTTHRPAPAPVGFTYTMVFEWVPSWSQWNLSDIVDVSTIGSPTLTFTSAGGWVSGLEAAILNILSGWINSVLTSKVIAAIDAAASTAALTAAGTVVGKVTGTTTLPAGVVLSISSIHTEPDGIHMTPALGAYGGLFSKLFPAGGSTSLCALTALAVLAPGVFDLGPFRRIRDEVLLRHSLGRGLVRWYYTSSPGVIRTLSRQPQLAAPAAAFVRAIETMVRCV